MNDLTPADRLQDVYNRMLKRYGTQGWWPGETRFEIMVGAVLTQATSWSNVEKAIFALKSADALSPASLRALNEQELAALIYSSGYYNAKARKLKALADFLHERFDDDLDEMAQEAPASLREELLSVHGIGEETADDILLYALDMPIFVVDSFTRRILFRLGLAPETGRYSTYQDLFTINLPPDPQLLGEYHALMVRHGGNICKKRPLCHGCCLLEICPTGRLNVARRPALHATDRG